MTWVLLFFAGIFEVIWAFFMKKSCGFTKLGPSLLTVVFMITSFGLLSVSMRTLPLGTGYVVWTGIGAVGTFLVGLIVLGEPYSTIRIVAAIMIALGILLMNLAS